MRKPSAIIKSHRLTAISSVAVSALVLFVAPPASAQSTGGTGGYGPFQIGVNGGGSGQDGATGYAPQTAGFSGGGGGGGGGAGGGIGGYGGASGPQLGGANSQPGGAPGQDGSTQTGTPYNNGSGGGGGNGGDHGLSVSTDFTNNQVLTGTNGGKGGNGGDADQATSNNSSAGHGGGGGAGGYGLVVTAPVSVTNTSSISGAGGGLGGNGGGLINASDLEVGGAGGGGGDGGVGISFNTSGGILNNSGSIQGGTGGTGGDVIACCTHSPSTGFDYGPTSGQGGNGGSGIFASGTNIQNTGTIQGGAGGTTGTGGVTEMTANGGSVNGVPKNGGAGGNGIAGSDLNIVNSGTIANGQGGTSHYGVKGADGYAVLFTAGTNILELHAGSVITGDALGQTGSNNTFILGGDTDATFADNVSSVTTGTEQYRGFQSNVKDGAGTWTLTGDTENWAIKKGILQVSDGNTSGSISGTVNTGSDAVTKGTLTFNRSDEVVFGTVISGTGNVVQKGAGKTILTAENTYSGGTTINAGILQIGHGGVGGSIIGNVVNNGTLAFYRVEPVTFDGVISGTGAVQHLAGSTTVLTGENTYTGGTTVSAGTLQIGDGTTGSIQGNAAIDANANLSFNRADPINFDGILSGGGSLYQMGAGTLTLTGDSSGFAGSTFVTGGTLMVNNVLGGTVAMASDTTLGGSGTIKGNTTLATGGATLLGRDGQKLTFDADLTLTAGNNVNVALGAPTTNGLFDVRGNLILDGTLNITDLGGFGPGLYRIFDYSGSLTDNGFALGTVPGGDTSVMQIQTTVQHQINLINTAGASLNFWNGGDATQHGNGTINGGDGIWNTVATNWTDADAVLSGKWKDDDFAIFTGSAGTVTVDNSGAGGIVTANGMQFSTTGYRIEGDALTLANTTAAPIIRVDKDVTATLEVELRGSNGLNKTDLGTLVLAGDNHYTGGTTVSQGILQLGEGGTTGNIDGDVALMSSANGTGTLAFDRSDTITFAGVISGQGGVLQQGAGTTTFTGNNTYSGGLTVRKGTAQAGIAENAFGSGRLTVNAGATADLNGFDITVAGLLDGSDGGGAVKLTTGSLTLNQSFDSKFSGILSGTGGLTKNSTGMLTLSGVNTYSGATTLNGGTLKQGVKGGLSGASAYTVATGSTLMLNGFNTVMAAFTNSGLADFGGQGGTVLSVTGNYTGNGGTVVLNTVLGDDSSKTDLLKIGGNTSGTTTVKVNNQGGLGAQTNEGIRVIEVGGSSDGTFSLLGTAVTKDGQQAVVAGAFSYTLHQGGTSTPDDGNWYLRSATEQTNQPVNPQRFNPGTPLYEGYGQTMQVLNKLPTLQQRVGNRYWSHAANPVIEQGADAIGTPLLTSPEAGAVLDNRAIWGRIEGAHNRFDTDRSTTAMKQTVNTLILQAGIDGQFYEGENGALIAGLTGQFGKARGNITSGHGDGKIDTQGWGLGGTLSWYGENGFYADGQAQAMWYTSDLNSGTANRSLIDNNKGFGYGLSLEAGKRVDLDDNWSLTPQAQLTWSSVKFDTFNDAWGASVSNRNGDSLNARLGISADYRNAWRDANGLVQRTNVYAIANLYQEFMGAAEVNVADIAFKNENDKTWGGIGAGGTYAWADDKYALYGEGSVNTSLNNFADSYTVKGTIGFRVKW